MSGPISQNWRSASCLRISRLATLLNGEAHIVDLPRELQPEALNKGMKLLSSKLATDWETIYFGGQYYMPGDPKFKADMPWTDRRVQAGHEYGGEPPGIARHDLSRQGTPMYVAALRPLSRAGILPGPNASTASTGTTPPAPKSC